MFRQSPSRNLRSKGFKIKHALQIFVLVAVCVWLLYQVKHSHDKKKAFAESNSKIPENIEIRHEILNFGRKDLHPRVDETASENEKHGLEEDTEEEAEDNKPEEEEEEEIKPEENEEEGRGVGDDEIDEQDQEKADEEAERGEDFIDEEEREREERESQEENEEKNEGHDMNTQEAREQHYKGDDASSAVVRDTQNLGSENVDRDSGNSNEEEHAKNTEKNEIQRENKTNGMEEVTINQNDSTITTEAHDQLEVGNNLRGENVSNDHVEVQNNSLTVNESLQNGTEITLVSTEDQNSTIKTQISNGDDSSLRSFILGQTENSNTTDTEPMLKQSEVKENDTVQRNESYTINGTQEAEDKSESSAMNANADSEIVDSSDSSISQEIKEAGIDLGTLPEIETEGKNNEDVAAE